MDKPICRLCGSRHYAAEAHHFGGEPEPPKKKARLKQGLTGDVFVPRGLYDELVRDALLWRKHRDKRKAYMQKRREKRDG